MTRSAAISIAILALVALALIMLLGRHGGHAANMSPGNELAAMKPRFDEMAFTDDRKAHDHAVAGLEQYLRANETSDELDEIPGVGPALATALDLTPRRDGYAIIACLP